MPNFAKIAKIKYKSEINIQSQFVFAVNKCPYFENLKIEFFWSHDLDSDFSLVAFL